MEWVHINNSAQVSTHINALWGRDVLQVFTPRKPPHKKTLHLHRCCFEKCAAAVFLNIRIRRNTRYTLSALSSSPIRRYSSPGVSMLRARTMGVLSLLERACILGYKGNTRCFCVPCLAIKNVAEKPGRQRAMQEGEFYELGGLSLEIKQVVIFCVSRFAE